jgi:tRNA(Leu) C34 or U34 (ribose-2'-O)-methylase TrmL
MAAGALVVDVAALAADARADAAAALGALRAAWPDATAPGVVVLLDADPGARPQPSLAPDPAAGVFVLPLAVIGVAIDDPHLYEAAAALAGRRVQDLGVVLAPGSAGVATAEALGCRVADSAGGLAAALAAVARPAAAPEVGVGPHPEPWPDDERLDPALLAHGDRRNVVDRYRYWREEAIVADLDRSRHRFHVAVENWRHDLNIGTVVRNANAFNAGGVHIVGRRRWNRRGAMATDRYLPVHHHPTIEHLVAWCEAEGLVLVGIDNVPGAVALDDVDLPEASMLLLGQEGPGLSAEAQAACRAVVAITQYGSTRSLNAGVASGIAMHAWIRRHAGPVPGVRLEGRPTGP